MAVGSPAVFHPVVQLGTVVTGVVRDSKGAPLANSRVFADNARTNAGMGAGLAADGTYTMLVMGPQWIKLQYVVSRDGAESLVGWHAGATSFEQARSVKVPRSGSRTVDITVPTS